MEGQQAPTHRKKERERRGRERERGVNQQQCQEAFINENHNSFWRDDVFCLPGDLSVPCRWQLLLQIARSALIMSAIFSMPGGIDSMEPNSSSRWP